MKNIIAILIAILFSATAYAEPILVGVHDNYKNDQLNIGVIPGYNDTININQCPPLDSPQLKGIQRITMELIIICKAIANSGIGSEIKLIPFPNTKRGMALLEEGLIHVMGNSLFDISLEKFPKLLTSPAIIREGEFEVGIFTTRNRHEVLKARTPEEIKKLTGVAVLSWYGDIRTMEALAPKKIVLVPKRNLLSRYIETRRADFTFSYLGEEVVTRIGGELVRIPGVKASFVGERYFAISPKRRDIYRALKKYIETQRQKPGDMIKQAFINAGFITPEYRDWIDVTQHKQK